MDTLFYLVHSMGSGAGFEEKELAMARTAAVAAARAQVKRIVYLGGLHPEGVASHGTCAHGYGVGRVLLAGERSRRSSSRPAS